MKQKILAISICTLMIISVLPVVGFQIQIEEIKKLNFVQSYYQTPASGYAPNPPSEKLIDIPVDHTHPEKTPATTNDVIINMLNQVNDTIYLRYLENITNFGSRVTGSDGCTLAADYIYNQFKSMGLTVRYNHYRVDNVEATINGSDKSNDEIYIICAHYDTVSSSPGADDDASGTAAVLLTAFIMSQYKFNHTIKFVAFSGEEQGLLGSRAYVADAVSKGWNIVGVLNADMISYAETTIEGNYLVVFQNDASQWLYNYTFDISAKYADYIHLTPLPGSSTSGSDHYSFWEYGYDALFYYESRTTPYYHTSEDTIAHINATYAVKNIRLMLATLAELSEARFLNNPPNAPVITGEINGAIQTSYTYVIQTTDPESDNVEYFINWGDNTSIGWIEPDTIEQIVNVNHSWDSEGTYSIRVKARDEHGAESDWTTLIVTMPLSYDKPMLQLFEKLFQLSPNASPLLRQLSRY